MIKISLNACASLAGAGALHEATMFGGIGFLLNGSMIAVSSKRGLLTRAGKERQRDALTRPSTQVMEMRGRLVEGYIVVDPAGLSDDMSWPVRRTAVPG
jgi:TfoX/Sxy family transcriptional regulator of competence genes